MLPEKRKKYTESNFKREKTHLPITIFDDRSCKAGNKNTIKKRRCIMRDCMNE